MIAMRSAEVEACNMTILNSLDFSLSRAYYIAEISVKTSKDPIIYYGVLTDIGFLACI